VVEAVRQGGALDGALEAAGLLSPQYNEVACDLFAGELLVPFAVLDQAAPAVLFPGDPESADAWEDAVDALASMFHVTTDLMRWRLRDLAALRMTSFYVG